MTSSFHEVDLEELSIDVRKDGKCGLCEDSGIAFFFVYNYIRRRCKGHSPTNSYKLTEQDIFYLKINGKL